MNKRLFLILTSIAVIAAAVGIIGSEWYTSQPKFCGSCHIMKNYYTSWMSDKHSKKSVACVDCHYAPGEKGSAKAKFKGLGQLFSYISTYTEETEVRERSKVKDLSCITSDCHPKQKLKDQRGKFTEKIPYIHRTHFDKTVDGQELHCSTCHTHVSLEKHFEVPKEMCYLCHFKGAKFNEGRGRCALCHAMPEKPIQKQNKEGESPEQPVTHKYLENAKVPCWSCHYELIQGKGEVKKENCTSCHHMAERLAKADDKILMHKKHIASQNAKCFDCHRPIQHKETLRFETAIQNCTACHPEPHIYQQLLITGTGGKGIDKPYPIAHNDVKLNCFACHVEDGQDTKGRKVKRASMKACVECHVKDKQKQDMAKKWQSDVAEYLQEAREMEKQALARIKNAKGKAPDKIIKKASALLKDGQENLRLVEAGGGVHNKKFSSLLIDTAMEKFEEAMGEVKK